MALTRKEAWSFFKYISKQYHTCHRHTRVIRTAATTLDHVLISSFLNKNFETRKTDTSDLFPIVIISNPLNKYRQKILIHMKTNCYFVKTVDYNLSLLLYFIKMPFLNKKLS